MIIQQMGLPTDTYPSYSLSVVSSVVTVTVAGVDVVASSLVADNVVHAEVRQLDDGTFAISNVGAYVGTVIIPALSYTANPSVTDGAGGYTDVAPTANALDANSLVLEIWPINTAIAADVTAADPA